MTTGIVPGAMAGAPCTHRQPIGTLLSWGTVATSFSLWEFGGTWGAEALEAELPADPSSPADR